MRMRTGIATCGVAVVVAVSLGPGCSTSSGSGESPDAAGTSGGEGGGTSSGASSGMNPGSSSGTGSGGSGGSSGGSNPGTPCDSGGPLALKAVWSLPAVTLTATTVDGQGNVYVAGTYKGTVSFGAKTFNGPTSAASEDMFLAKYDASGHLIFANSYGTPTGIYDPPAIAADPAGNVFMGGGFAGTLAFGGGTTALVAATVDAFAVKVSPTGQTLWADHFGYDAGGYSVLSIAVGPDGNPVIAGTSGGPITLGSKTWQASSAVGANQPFIAKLSSANGSVTWSNAGGGNIAVAYMYLALDAQGRPFLAARVDSGGCAWGDETDADVGYFTTLRAGFDADGSIRWGQMDHGAIAVAAAVDTAGRFSVVEYTFDGVTLGGGSDASVDSTAGNISLVGLFSPTDGTPISTFAISDTDPWSSATDAHGNTILTGTFWPGQSPIPVGSYSIPVVFGSSQPLFVAAVDGASHAVGLATMGPDNDAQPLGIAIDPTSGTVYVPGLLTTAFTSTVGPLQPGPFIAVFGPDPCDDGAGPLGSATGNPSDHGDLGPDATSPYSASDAAPAPCPATQAEATNGAACPVAMGCSFGTTCCLCTPTACNGQPTTWTCDPLGTPNPQCPASPPAPLGTCPSGVQCNYCLPGGRFYANCTAAGWATGYAQLLCE
jgi:hypothetical protein